MCSRADSHRPPQLVFRFLAPHHQFPEIAEFARAVCVGENDVLPSGMPHPMRDRPSLASILLQLHDPDRPGCDSGRLRWPVPRSFGRGSRFYVVRPREVQDNFHRLVPAAVAYDDDLPASSGVCLSSTSLQAAITAAFALGAVVAVLLFEVLYCFLQHARYTVLLVVGRYH